MSDERHPRPGVAVPAVEEEPLASAAASSVTGTDSQGAPAAEPWETPETGETPETFEAAPAAPARDPRFLRGVERLAAEGDGTESATVPRPAPEATPPPELSGDVLPFRRAPVKPRRKRRNPWLRLLRPLATGLLVVALPASLAGWVLTSPRFALAEIRVAGTERVEADWVQGRLSSLRGRNLVELPLAEVETALAGHPWIEGVAIRKQLPAALAVEVRERTPKVLVPAPGGRGTPGEGGVRGEGSVRGVEGGPALWLADATGRPIVPAPPGSREHFVVVVPAAERGATAGALADSVPGALSVAADLSRVRPVWAAALDRLEALGDGEYRVVTAALPFPVLVREGDVEEPAEHLDAALPVLRRHYGEIERADLRFPGRLVLRPVEAPPPLRRDSISDATRATREGAPPSPADDTRREVG